MLCGIETRDYTLFGEARWSIHVICITTRRTIRSKRPTPRSWAFRRIGTRGRAVLRRRITFTGSGVAARRAFTDCRSVRVAGIKMQRTSLAARTCRLTSWRTRSQVEVDRLRLNSFRLKICAASQLFSLLPLPDPVDVSIFGPFAI